MERFYIVKPESNFYRSYFDWKSNVSENNRVIVDFFVANGICAREYYASKDFLGIIPRDTDKENFKNQFRVLETNEGLKYFKKNSVIGKKWLMLTSSMRFLSKPSPAWLNKHLVERSSSRLFYYNGNLYASVSADNVSMPDYFQEIRGSEFYRVMEEMSDD